MALLNDVIGRVGNEAYNSEDNVLQNAQDAGAEAYNSEHNVVQTAGQRMAEIIGQREEATVAGKNFQNPQAQMQGEVSQDYYRDEQEYEDTGAVGSFMNKLGNVSNDMLGTNFDTTEVIDGKKYISNNKNFNDQSLGELRNDFNNLKEDPNGKQTMYYMRVENDDGSFSYKTGVAEAGAVDRYKNENLNSKTTILYDKRLSDADAMEAQVHGNKNALKYRRNDLGQNRDEFGGGYTELYNMDILGLDGSVTQKKINNINMSTRDKWQDMGIGLPVNKYDEKAFKAGRDEIRKRRELYGDDDAKANEMEGQLRQIEGEGDGIFTKLNKSQDAFQSGLHQLVVGTGDLVLDVMTPGNNKWLDKYKSAEYADKVWGYDRRQSEHDMNKALSQWRDRDYVSAAWTAFRNPEVVAQSLPEMAAMFTGGGALTKIGKEAAAMVEASGSIISKAAAAEKLMKTATTGQKAAYKLADNAGLLTTSAQQTNNNIDERMKNNNGKDVSMVEAGLMFATTTALLATDKMAFSQIVKGENINLIKKTLDSIDASGMNKVVKSVLKNGTQMAEAGGKELAQEYFQQWGEILSQQLGTEKHGTSVFTEENFDNALKAGIAGMGAGAQMHGVGSAVRKAGEVTEDSTDDAFDGIGKAFSKAKDAAGFTSKDDTETESKTESAPNANNDEIMKNVKAKAEAEKAKAKRVVLDNLPYDENDELDIHNFTEQQNNFIEQELEKISQQDIIAEEDFEIADIAIDYNVGMIKDAQKKGATEEQLRESVESIIAFKQKISKSRTEIANKKKVSENTLKDAVDNPGGESEQTILNVLGSSDNLKSINDETLNNLASNGLGIDTGESGRIQAAAQAAQGVRIGKTKSNKLIKEATGKAGPKTIKSVMQELFRGQTDKYKGAEILMNEARSYISGGKTSQAKTNLKQMQELLDSQKVKIEPTEQFQYGSFTGRDGVERSNTKDFHDATTKAVAILEDMVAKTDQSINTYEDSVKQYGAKTARERAQGSDKADYQAPDTKTKPEAKTDAPVDPEVTENKKVDKEQPPLPEDSDIEALDSEGVDVPWESNEKAEPESTSDKQKTAFDTWVSFRMEEFVDKNYPEKNNNDFTDKNFQKEMHDLYLADKNTKDKKKQDSKDDRAEYDKKFEESIKNGGMAKGEYIGKSNPSQKRIDEVKENSSKSNLDRMFIAIEKHGRENIIEGKDYDGNWYFRVRTKPKTDTKAEKTQDVEDVEVSIKPDVSSEIKINPKTKKITYTDGSTRKEIKSFDELLEISKQYSEALYKPNDQGRKDFDEEVKRLEKLFNSINNAGLEFQPFDLTFGDKDFREEAGLGNSFGFFSRGTDKNGIIIFDELRPDGRHPLQTIMHEYAHNLTVAAVEDNPKIYDRILEIMMRPEVQAMGNNPDTGYAVQDNDPLEFIAEAMTNMHVQKALLKIESDGKNGKPHSELRKIWEDVLRIVRSLTKKNALTDTLALFGPTQKLAESDTAIDKQDVLSNQIPGNEDYSSEYDEFNSEPSEEVEIDPQFWEEESTKEDKSSKPVEVNYDEKEYTVKEYEEYEAVKTTGEKMMESASKTLKKFTTLYESKEVTEEAQEIPMSTVNNFLDVDQLNFARQEQGLDINTDAIDSVAAMQPKIDEFKKKLLETARLSIVGKEGTVFTKIINDPLKPGTYSHALGFFESDKDGNITADENLMNIMFNETMTHIHDDSQKLTINDWKTINAIIGDQRDSIPSRMAQQQFTYAGVRKTFFMDSLAKKIKLKLPIVAVKNNNDKVDEQNIEKVALGFAHLATEVMIQNGILQNVEVSSKDGVPGNPLDSYRAKNEFGDNRDTSGFAMTFDSGKSENVNVQFLRFARPDSNPNNIKLSETADGFKDDARNYSADINELSDVEKEGKTFSHNKEDIKRHKLGESKVVGSPEYATEKQIKSMNALQDQEYQITDAANLLLELSKDSDNFAKKLLGFTDDIDTMVHRDDRESVESQNSRIINVIEQLKEVRAETDIRIENEESDGFYYQFKTWVNNRIGMISSKLNAQSDGDVRFLIGLKTNDVKVTSKPKDFNEREAIAAYRTAIVQALGGTYADTFGDDKSSYEKNMEDFNLIYNDSLDPESTLGKAAIALRWRNDNPGKEMILEHKDAILQASVGIGGHGLLGLTELSKYNPDGEFKTQLPMETDAVTSGVMLSLLQYPVIEDTYKWLNRGGFFFKGQEIKSMGKWLQDPENFDSYQTIAKSTNENLKSIVEKEQINSNPTKKAQFAVIEKFAGKLVDIKGQVTKAGRSFAKSPLMTFFYGSSTETIRAKIVKDITLKTRELLTEINAEKDADKKKVLIEEYMNIVTLFDPNNIEKTRLSITSNPLEHSTTGLENKMSILANETYGAAIEESMSSIFENIVAIRKAVNNTNKLMFELFEIRMENAIENFEAINGFEPNKKQMEQLVVDLEGTRPRFKTFEGHATVLKNGVDADTYGKNLNRVQTAHYGETKSTSSYNIKREYKINQAGAPVIIIHSGDSSIVMEVPIKFNAMQIFDASVFNLNDAYAGTKYYNEQTIEKFKNFSTMDSVNDQAQRLIRTFKAMAENGEFRDDMRETGYAIDQNAFNTANMLKVTDEARANVFEWMDFVEHAVMSGEELGGGIAVNSDSNVEPAAGYKFIEYKKLAPKKKGKYEIKNEIDNYVMPVKKVNDDIESAFDRESFQDAILSSTPVVSMSGVAGYDKSGRIVDNLRLAKYSVYKQNSDLKDNIYVVENIFTGDKKTFDSRSAKKPYMVVAAMERKSNSIKPTDDIKNDFDRTREKQKSKSLVEGDPVLVSSEIHLANGETIQWDMNPESTIDRSGPDVPIEPSSFVKYRKIKEFESDKGSYDIYEVKIGNKAWTSVDANGNPLIVIKKIKARKGVSEAAIKVAIRNHSIDYKDHKTAYVTVESDIKNGRMGVTATKYDAAHDARADAYKKAQQSKVEKRLASETKVNPETVKPDGDTLASSEKASGTLEKGSYEKLTPENILSFAKSLNTWDGSTDEDVGFFLNTLQEIVIPLLKADQEVTIQQGTSTGENYGEVSFSDTGKENIIDLYESKGRPTSRVGQSMLEVYTHEFSHIVSAYLLQNENTSYVQRSKLNNLYEAVRKNKNITFESFLNRDNSGNIFYTIDKEAEIKKAKEVYNYVFNNKNGEHLNEFVAYGLSNKNFAASLKSINTTNADLEGKSAFEKLLSTIKQWLNNLLRLEVGKQRTKNAHASIINSVRELNGANKKRQNFLVKMLKKSSAYARNADVALKFKIGKVFNADAIIVQNVKGKTRRFFSHIYNASKIPAVLQEDSARGRAFRKIGRKANIFDERGLAYSLYNSITTDGFDMADFIRAGLKSKSEIDRKRDGQTAAEIELMHDAYGRDLTEQELSSLQLIGLETDISVLVDYIQSDDTKMGFNEIIEMLNNDGVLTIKIREIENKIISENSDSKFMITQAKGLGSFMSTGKQDVVGQLLNAHLIAKRAGSNKELPMSPLSTEFDIDVLATLYAIKGNTMSQRSVFADMLSSDGDATKMFMIQHENAKKDALKRNFAGNKTQQIKGYSVDLVNQDIEVKIIAIKDLKNNDIKMKNEGFRKEGTIYDPITKTEKNIWVSDEGSMTGYNPGIIPRKDLGAKGTSILKSLIEKNNDNYKVARAELKNIIADVQSKSGTIDKKYANLVPIFNAAGKIVDLRIMMNKEQKLRIFRRDNDGIKSLGKMVGAIEEKANQNDVFDAATEALAEDKKAHFSKEPDSFVFVGEYTEKDRAKSPEKQKLYEMWQHIPEKAKMSIREQFGENGFMIRKKAVRAVLGDRDATMANMSLYGKKLLENAPKARKVVRMGEKFWKKLINFEKLGIVIKTPEVLLANITSNSIALAQNGISIDEVLKMQYEGAIAAMDYVKDDAELRKLNLGFRGDTISGPGIAKNKARIKQLEKRLATNPIAHLVEEGFLQSVVEDVDVTKHRYKDPTLFDPKNKSIEARFEKTKKKYGKKVPKIGKEAFSQAYMTEDTATFNMLMKSTQYSDLVARYTLDKMTQKNTERLVKEQDILLREDMKKDGTYTQAAIEAKSKEQADAIRKEADEKRIVDLSNTFINYEEIDHWAVKYANDMGILMFSKFLIGIQRVIFKMIKERPATALAILSLQFLIGDAEDPLDSSLFFGTDPLSRFKLNPLEHVDNAFSPHGLNLILDTLDTVTPG